jgi:hypothetical protein
VRVAVIEGRRLRKSYGIGIIEQQPDAMNISLMSPIERHAHTCRDAARHTIRQ